LETRNIILNFKNQKALGIDGIMTEILQKVGPALWRKIHGLIKTICKYPWKMETVYPTNNKR